MNGFFYDFILAPLERTAFAPLRQRLIFGAKSSVPRALGQVVEIGMGTGANLRFYPPGTMVTGVEPDDSMRDRAVLRAERERSRGVVIRVVKGEAEALPFPDLSFDTAVATLVFCSLRDPESAVQEIGRVLKPGGYFLAFEHVRHNWKWLGRLLDWFTPLWRFFADGCHLNRDPESLFREARFEIVQQKRLWLGFGKMWVLRKPEKASRK